MFDVTHNNYIVLLGGRCDWCTSVVLHHLVHRIECEPRRPETVIVRFDFPLTRPVTLQQTVDLLFQFARRPAELRAQGTERQVLYEFFLRSAILVFGIQQTGMMFQFIDELQNVLFGPVGERHDCSTSSAAMAKNTKRHISKSGGRLP